ncbi:MAG TPA: inositol monophosphatase [Jatrophihabitans sp.]|nr:inositol monophosphatase [Jatrophihabitans sp.]
MTGYLPAIDDFTLAADLVQAAGRLAARMLADGLETRHKGSVSDVVSAADHAAEELVVSGLRQARPTDGIVGEEGTELPGERTWFVDPVDGTYNFLSGLPYWCSALALAERSPDGDWTPLLGAVYHPAADELWLGGVGHPTSCNGNPVPRLTDAPLAELSLTSYLHPPTLSDDAVRQPLLSVLSGAATLRMLGSGSVELAAVAAGRVGAWLQRQVPEWDWLPGAVLVTAAGGQIDVVQHRGQRWHIAGNGQAVAEIRRLLIGNPAFA